MTEQERAFNEHMQWIYKEAKMLGNNARIHLEMTVDLGGVEAACKEILNHSEGFGRLWELERLDLTRIRR